MQCTQAMSGEIIFMEKRTKGSVTLKVPAINNKADDLQTMRPRGMSLVNLAYHKETGESTYSKKTCNIDQCKINKFNNMHVQNVHSVKRSQDISITLQKLRELKETSYRELSAYGQRTLSHKSENIVNRKIISGSQQNEILSKYLDNQWEHINKLHKKVLSLPCSKP